MTRASLNHAFRLVWNDRLQAFVPVAETARGKGRRSGHALTLLAASLLLAGPALAVDPGALPTGGQITAGQGGISQTGQAMTVNQSTQNLIMQWQGFDIGQAASVRFVQPNAQAAVLNRVLSSNPTQILGRLNANGRVFIINPQGVLFGATARVDVGGLVASSLNLSDDDFRKGKLRFSASPNAGVVRNLGEIVAREGGFVSLLGAQVNNAGKLTAPGGQVALAAGQNVRLDITDSGLVGVQVDGATATARVDNSGHIAADGGRVWLTARQAGPMIATAINQTGTVRANTLGQRQGEVWLDGGPTGDVRLAGTTEARGINAGEQGGTVVATGGKVSVSGTVDASGAAGGGNVKLGGGWQGREASIAEAGQVDVAQSASVKADATEDGQGGTIVLWSADSTQLDGSLSARGAGTGLGGQVETSSRGQLGVRGRVLVGAGGLWLLDPTNLTVVASGATGTDINASTIEATLNTGGNVTVQADNNININADIAKTSGGTSTLIFQADNQITLGSAGVSRKISASNDAGTPTVTSSLNVIFQGNGGAVATANGSVNLYGEISTNGGNATFYKPTLLSNAKPVSTRVLTPNPTNPSASTTPDSGNVTFHKAVTLAGNSSVTIDTQSVQDSSQTYLRKGGNVEFKEAITSLDPSSPRALVINTTGAVSIQAGFPGSVGGSGNANYSGGVTFGGNVGTVANPLDSLTIVGPSYVYLNAAEINLRKQAGDTMTFDSPGDYLPALVLGQANTSIRVTGFSAGSADYKQATFDIVAGNNLSGAASLTIDSDRSIQIAGAADAPRLITGRKQDNSGNVALTVNLRPSQKAAANSGSITLQNAAIRSQGGDVNLASTTQRAYGVASEQNADGVRIQASTLDSRASAVDDNVANDGQIRVYGNTATSATTGGTAVNLYGSTNVLADTADITLNGRVNSTSGGANKDAVLIGNRGQATVTLGTTSGAISVLGDASGVGQAATVGASYNGVEITDAAMVRTVSGDIQVTGKGGGGNNNNVGENHGIRLKDTDTQIVSQTGNITLTGLTGGKTTSYGIHAAGADIAIGQERNTDTAKSVVTARPFSGNIDLVADTLDVVNNSSSRMRVMSTRTGGNLATGQLNIRPYHDVAIQIGGTEPSPPSSDNPTAPDKPLFLDSTWFAGSNAVFLPGFGEITVGRYGSTAVGGSGSVLESTKTLAVAGATTVRDPLNLLMRGTGGQVSIDAALNVVGASNAARVLNIEANAGITGTQSTSLVAVDKLRLAGGGPMILTGPNLVNTLAAENTSGELRFSNAQALLVDQVTANYLGAAVTTTGITTVNQPVTVGTTAGDLSVNRNVAAGIGTVGLFATAGAVKETGTAIVSAGKLSVRARDSSSLANANQVGVLAATVSGSAQNLTFVGANGVSIESVTEGGGTTNNGLSLTGRAYVQAQGGAITQTARIAAGGLGAEASGDIDLSLNPATNAIGTFAARSGAGEVKLRNNAALSVGTVSVTDAASVTRTLAGINTQAAGKAVSLATATGGITLNDSITSGSAGNRGAVRLQAATGAVTEAAANTAANGAPIVTAQQLAVVANGNSSLANDNQVVQLAASITGAGQGLTYTNATAVEVGQVVGVDGSGGASEPLVAAVTGIAAPGDVSITTQAGNITQSQNLTVGGLHVHAVNGDVVLTRTTNAIGNLAARLDAAGRSISVSDVDGLSVGSVSRLVNGTSSSTAGITTTNGAVTLNASADGASTAGDLAVNESVNAGTAVVTLGSGRGNVSVAASKAVQAASAVLTAAQAVNLQGNLTTTGNATVTAQSNIVLAGVLTSSTGTVGLTATTGSVTETGTGHIVAPNLSVIAANASSLDSSTNAVGTLAARITGAGQSFAYADADALTIGTVGSVSGVSTTGGDISLRSAGTATTDNLLLNQAVSTGYTTGGSVIGTVSLGTAGGGVSGPAPVTARRLAVRSAGNVSLTNAANNVETLAAVMSAGTFEYHDTDGFAVGIVDTTVPLAASLSGVSSSGEQRLVSDGVITLQQDLNAGGVLDLLASDGIVQTGGRLSAAALRVNAGGDVSLTSTANHADTVAASVGTGGFAYRDAGSVTVGTVTHTTGGSTTGIDTDGAVWVRTGANLNLAATVTARAAGNQALVLAATRAFTNQAGASAISAPNGRWLVYDDNLTLADRFDGLGYNFRRLLTLYDDYPPASVAEQGNGYITTAKLIDPDQFFRQAGGSTMEAGASGNATLSVAIPSVESAMGEEGKALVLDAASGRPVAQLPSGPTAFAGISASAEPSVPAVPLQASVRMDKPFSVALGEFVRGGRVLEASLADGSPLPRWLSLDRERRRLVGRTPAGQLGPWRVRIAVQPPVPGAAPVILWLDIVAQPDAQVAIARP